MQYIYLVALFFLYNYVKNGIYSVPGSIQISFWRAIYYIYWVFCNKKPTNLVFDFNSNYKRIYGNSCRQLFETYISLKKKNNPDMTIGVTPIHHTSFRNIIEKYFDQNNIIIFDLDNECNRVNVPDNLKNKKIDLILVTHLWGYDLDMSELDVFRNKAVFVEDKVIGGKYSDKTKTNADLYFHSCGMDKRPASISGGYVDINNDNINDIILMENFIKKLPLNTFYEKLSKISDIMLLNIIYNGSFLQQIIKIFCLLTNNNLSDIVHMIRKSKPGFSHGNFMKCPNQFMVNEIIRIDYKVFGTEELFISKNNYFKSKITNYNLKKYFPWKLDINYSTLPYNPILVEKKNHNKFFKYFNTKLVPILKNPTYVTFENASIKYKNFLDNIIYLPNLYKMNIREINNLTNYLEEIL